MSGFGGRSSGGGGGGGGGGNRGRGRGRSSSSNYQGRGHTRTHPPPPETAHARLRPCSTYTTTGTCPNGANCHFAHIVKLHASIDATSTTTTKKNNVPPSNYHQNRFNNNNNNATDTVAAAVSSVAIWETQGVIKIFTGSHDGYWRLWNTQTFVKEFEHQLGKVECVEVASNFLFCGLEGISVQLPDVHVGMIHAWNLARPTDAPLEFHMHPTLIPYAHASAVTTLTVEGETIVSGSRDGSIRVWTYDVAGNQFKLLMSIHGHAGEVTGLQVVDNLLWSSSVDGSIRLWDLTKQGECQYAIIKDAQNPKAAGHAQAVTGLLKFVATPASGTFVLSSSLDGTIKAWNGANGECVASESHGDGVVSMALSQDLNGNPLLLVGLERGNIMIRNVVQTPKAPAFCLLCTLSANYTAGHDGAVKAIREGPSSTFYSGGNDGKLLVWQITGDLGI